MLSKNFIQRGKEFTTFEKFVPAPYFRKTFSLSETPKNAVINICGLGFYRLFINGEEITKGFLAPYISNPDEIFFYDSYEVADKLTEGKNVIAVVLGNGYLNNPGGDIWQFDKAPFRDAPKLAMSFEADGKVLFEADESFKCAPSPIVFDDYRCGEHYDATKEIPDWNKTDFDDGKWQNAIKAKTPLGKPALCNSEPIVKVAEYSPTEFYKSDDKWVYVFPYNRAGVCKLRIKGKRGQKVVLTYGEVIKEGKVDLKNIIFDKTSDLMHKDAYTLKGEGVEEYTPSFTYHGFQFVSVEGMTDEQAVKDALTFVAFNSDIKSAGTFSCSDETLNKLQELVRRADLANFHYFPTDCPQREKNGWTGDISCSAEQLTCNFHCEKSLAVWLDCARAEQLENGNIPSIIPTAAGWGISRYNGPAWAAALIDAPYNIYKYTGDKKILTDNFDAIMKLCRYEAEQIRDDGLLGYGLGDWAQPRHHVGSPETPNDITDTLTVIDQCEKIKQMATVLGRKGDSVYAENLARRLKDSFRKIYIEGGKIKEPFASQTAIAMCIHYKVFQKEETPIALEQLVENIRSKDDHFDTGVLGSKVLYRVLSENGYADLAYRLITRDTFPSYAEQMSHGATALWECFVEVDKGENVASLNHHFWGDISAWFFRCLVGLNINPDLKDPYLIEVSPKFVKGITFAKAEREYMGEKISVEWVFDNGEYKVTIQAPAEFRVVRV